MCHNIKKNKVIILLETNNNVKAIKSQHPKKVSATSQTTKGTLIPPPLPKKQMK
jgi:hypothetical protein